MTALTQVEGLVWRFSLRFLRPRLVFALGCAAFWSGAQVLAPVFGRVPLPCSVEVLWTHSLPARTRALIEILAADARTGTIFVEPPLDARLGGAGEKIGFQGCRAARHDGQIHVQL